MNTIKNLWADLQKNIADKSVINIPELKRIIKSEWEQISSKTRRNLALGYKKRALDLL